MQIQVYNKHALSIIVAQWFYCNLLLVSLDESLGMDFFFIILLHMVHGNIVFPPNRVKHKLSTN